MLCPADTNEKILKAMLSGFFGGATQVFAFGEYARSLRLVSELPDLREGHVNWTPLRRWLAERSSKRVKPPRKEKRHPEMGCRFPWRRHPDLNWGMRVLQTLALPLGYGA